MLVRCPYLDCLSVYESANADKSKFFIIDNRCPRCGRLGRAKSLDIVKVLQKRISEQGQDINLSVRNDAKFLALLEDIRSLWNVGSMFRTADAAGISMLYLSGITGIPPQKEISKTALGAENVIPWHYTEHALNVIPQLKNAGIIVIGLERNSQSINLIELLKNKKIKSPLCMVVGNENKGLSPETIEQCDYICSLPMRGQKESLNVAAAFAVAAYFISDTIFGA